MLRAILNNSSGDAALSRFATTNTWAAVQTFSAGIQFGGGTSTLNYYEEGTWTPGVQSTGATFSINASNTVGRYTRIGKMVFCEFAVQLSGATTGTTSNVVFLTGLPFTPQLLGSVANDKFVLSATGFTIALNNGGLALRLLANSTPEIKAYYINGGLNDFLASTFSGNGARICGAFHYQVA